MTVLFLKYVPRKYKLDNHSFSHSGTQHILTGTAQGKGMSSAHMERHRHPPPLHTSPQAPPPLHWVHPLLTMAVQDASRDTSAFYWESYSLV